MVQQANDRVTWTLTMDDFEADLKNGRIVHPDNPVLNWCAANICAAQKGISRVPVKPTKDAKIDVMIATLMAYAAYSVAPPPTVAPMLMFV